MVFLGKGLKPDLWVSDIYVIDLSKLKGLGIKALFFDIDNTLVQYSDKVSDEKLNLWLENVINDGFKIGFLSNAKDKRINTFAEGVTVNGEKLSGNQSFRLTGSARKPLKVGFKRLSKMFNVRPEEVAMVGDQLFTDIWGAICFGCYTILVDPINRLDDHWFVSFKRRFEELHLKNVKKGQ